MKEEWIKALGNMTFGIYVLTSAYEDKINAMIASWVTPVSYEPLLVVTAIHPNRYSHQLVEGSGCFALHSLPADRKDFLQRFKGPDPGAKFDALDWERRKTGCPVLRDSNSCLECTVMDRCSPGNHTLFIGKVVDVHNFADGAPLTTHDYSGIYLGRE